MDGGDSQSATTRFVTTEAEALRDVSLADRYDLSKPIVLLSGMQALLRLTLAQRAADQARGWRTAGYVTGYRGSPLGGLDLEARRAKAALAAADITFEPALNEDLAVTAIWGAQQAQLRGQGRVDGVFSIFYAKGPGFDRSGDALRHANLAGVAAKGGVLAAMGDDHICESSTTCHQSDFALVDAQIPVLHPAGAQEILDFGLIGWGMSRFTGCWVGLKCVKDTVEASTVVSTEPGRIQVATPEHELAPRGRNIILGESPQSQEARLIEWRAPSIAPYARANKLDQRRIGRPGARFGIAAAGKSWLDVLSALELLGVDAVAAERIGLSAYKIGLAWPLDETGMRDFADGLRTLLIVEEKRPLIETQIKVALYPVANRPTVIGETDQDGRTLLQAKMDLDPLTIALAIGRELSRLAPEVEDLAARVQQIEAAARAPAPDLLARTPYFCAGCPHNSSTKLPEGARGGAGIGCHYLVQLMDRDTLGYTHMGAEGANWIGEAKFIKGEGGETPHLFQNIGDGGYNHSGLMAIRAAVGAGVNITYKLLYNDAVAMTGGQGNDGGLTPQRAARELLAIGVKKLAVVLDAKEAVEIEAFPEAAEIHFRDQLELVQRRFREISGVTAILYIQTCAAEKRRRRRRGLAPDPAERVIINDLICEGCGDCGIASNCVAVTPLETEFGRKRQIDQSSCNKDFSCLDGFCPSFVTVRGGMLKPGAERAGAPSEIDFGAIPEAPRPALQRPRNLLITGVGGTGLVTIGAVLGMAAHLEGKGAGVLEMAGLAQKGGAVMIHCRIAPTPDEVTAIRIAPGQADVMIGGDLVVSGGAKALGLLAEGRGRAVINDHEIFTGEFTRDPGFELPTPALKSAITARTGAAATLFLNATKLAEALLGDAIFSNMLLLGAAWQRGLAPVSAAALLRAIDLNGVEIERNRRAFEIGRWAAHAPDQAAALLAPSTRTVEDLDRLIERRIAFLTEYQDAAWGARYAATVEVARRAEERVAPASDRFARNVAVSLFKLMAYKDEYEVARLHAETTRELVAKRFDGVRGLRFHLAPPFLSGKDAQGRPRKRAFGGWMLRVFRLLRHGKRLRGGAFDPFGYGPERRLERALIDAFECDVDLLVERLSAANIATAIEIASLPQGVRGFGPVKQAAADRVATRRAELLARLDSGAASDADLAG